MNIKSSIIHIGFQHKWGKCYEAKTRQKESHEWGGAALNYAKGGPL